VIDGVLLGVIQGIFEWLPVSSEGVLVAVMSVVSDISVEDSIRYAFWLHLGTSISAAIVFRHRIRLLVSQTWQTMPVIRSVEVQFLVIATIVSFCVGGVILLTVDILLREIGLVVMTVIGVCMILTGSLQLKRRAGAERSINHLTISDALLVGVAQGIAVVPGFSRSGFTVATLVWRGYGFKDCLELSILMSIPASLGASIVGAITSTQSFALPMLVAMVVATVVGLLMIRGLLAFARRVNLGVLVMLSGLLMVVAGMLLSN